MMGNFGSYATSDVPLDLMSDPEKRHDAFAHLVGLVDLLSFPFFHLLFISTTSTNHLYCTQPQRRHHPRITNTA